MRPAPVFALLVLMTLAANRTPPKWQAFGNVSLDLAAACAKVELGKFGAVKDETGEEPEAGARRLYLSHEAAKGESRAIIYMNGEPSFTAMWMDAEDTLLGDRIWHQIENHCGIS
jgi:hypothetical protein